MNKGERNHISKLLFDLVSGIFNQVVIALLAYRFLNRKLGTKITLIILGIYVIGNILNCFLSWYKTTFYFKDKSIFYTSGVFNIIKREIPFDKINTIDISENIFQRMFYVAKLKIDTGKATDSESEVSLVLKRKRAFEIKRILNSKGYKSEIEKEEKLLEDVESNSKSYKQYQLKLKDIILYSLIITVSFKGIGIIFVLFNLLDDVGDILSIDMSRYLNKGVDSLGTDISHIAIVLIIAIIAVICTSTIYNSFKYYDFRINVEDDKLHISYGSMSRKSYSFDRNKIKGIHIKQSLLMQIFNIRIIELETIGYGDEKGESAVLYPICNEEMQNKILKDLLPEFLFEGELIKPPKHAYIRFILWKVVFVGIAIVIMVIKKFKYSYLGIIPMIIALILGYLQYKNTSISTAEGLVYMSYNGFNKKQSIVKTNAIQALTISYNYFQKRAGLCNYYINIPGGILGKYIQVHNLQKNISIKLGDS